MTSPRASVIWLQPLILILVCWGFAGALAAMTLANLEQLDLVRTFMRREGISTSAFGALGVIWILIGVLSFALGDLAARTTRPVPRPAPLPMNTSRIATFCFIANLVLLAVTALWIVTSASKLGGLIYLAAAAYADTLTTRDILLENKLFTGMRLFYAALPATACLAAALLATGTLRRRKRWLMWAVLIINTVALLILPLVMSQRLLLLQLLLSAYFAACLVRGRIFGVHWVGIGITLFLVLWIGREGLTNPIIQRPALEIATQKLAFYVVNDMFNAVAPMSVPIHKTNGGILLEGVMFFSFTDSYFLSVLGPRLEALDPVIGGGEFPFFTAAYVDFGAKGGVIFICLTGFVLRRIYARAAHNLGWAVVYAQIAAALMFSSHSVYFLHQNFFFSAALIGLLVSLGVRQARPAIAGHPRRPFDPDRCDDAV